MKKKLPTAPASRIDGVSCDITPSALERWNPQLRTQKPDPVEIEMFDVIGFDPWSGEGVTARAVQERLRGLAEGTPVSVSINSPGGDMFEGLAIYNMLREHKGDVTIKVLGLAASAASIIAMAGDTVQIARAGFLMIHNSWVVAMGNRHDLREYADTLEPFDRAMADIYAVRSGGDAADIAGMMDKETWLGGSEAVDKGFADSLLDSDQVSVDTSAKAGAYAARKMDVMLAKSGMTRSERRKLMQEFKTGTPGATGNGEDDPTGESTQNAALAQEVAQLSRELTRILS
jgi:ATP-dependent protease ClpP protease subunit